MRLPARWIVTARRIGFPLALLVLASVGVLTYTQLRQLRSDIAWRAHTHLAIEHIERMHASILAAESLRRTYRLSRAADDRDQMNERIRTAQAELDRVDQLTRDNPVQQAHVKDLRPLLLARIAVIHDGLELPDWELLDANVREDQRTQQVRGTVLSKRITAEIDAMRREETHLLSERDERSKISADNTQQFVLYGGALGIVLVAFFSLSLVSENRRRVRSQAELQRSNAIITGVLNGTTDAVAVKDLEGRYLLANPAVLSNFKVRESEILGKTDAQLVGNETGRGIMTMDREVMRTAKTITVEQVVTIGERTWTFLATKGPYLDSSGKVRGVIAISRDITERKKIEARIAEQNDERGRIIARLERQSQGLSWLAETARHLQSVLTLEEACQLIGQFAQLLFDTAGELGLTDSQAGTIESRVHWGERAPSPAFAMTQCCALRSQGTHTSSAGTGCCEHLATASLPQTCVALSAQGKTLGLLQLDGDGFDDDQERLLAAFAEQVGLALANLELRETLRGQAIRDPLTGLFNRRYMDETLARELVRAQRKAAPLSVMMMDIDHFKRLNDTYGHATGDEVLKRVAQRLSGSVRREDVACRYGGEEFALILPDLSLEQALERTEKVRVALSELEVPTAGHGNIFVSASFGVACFPANGASSDALLRAADEALYQAKQAGRNRVFAAAGARTSQRMSEA